MSPYQQREAWITGGSCVPGFHRAVEQELKRLSLLEANWDAQGALRIDPRLIDAARRFAVRIPPDLIWAPAVVPMAKGNLQFEWHDGPRSLEFEFGAPDSIHYLKWHPEDGIEEEGFLALDDNSAAESLIRWFVGDEPNA